MMMTVTITKLQTYILALIVRQSESDFSSTGAPQLVEMSWLSHDEWWTDSKSFAKLKAHYKLVDKDFKFIEKHNLVRTDPAQAVLLDAIMQVDEYAQEERKHFDLPLDLSLGTQFQQRVWRELQKIKLGETISYATLAIRIGNPKAYRAVANANSKNPFSLIIPCHRVIASDGKLGGYTGGLDKKEYLLALEGVKCRS